MRRATADEWSRYYEVARARAGREDPWRKHVLHLARRERCFMAVAGLTLFASVVAFWMFLIR